MPLRLLCFLVALWIIPSQSFAVEPDLARQSPDTVIRRIVEAVGSSAVASLDPWLTPHGQATLEALGATERRDRALRKLGPVVTIDVTSREETADGTHLEITATHPNGESFWTIAFRDDTARIDDIGVDYRPASPQPSAANRHHALHRFARPAPQPGAPKPNVAADDQPPATSTDPSPAPGLGDGLQPPDARTVDFLLATTRKTQASGGSVSFTAERSPTLQYGTVRVHVPAQDQHTPGHVELPRQISLFGLTLYEEKLDEKKHFVIQYARLLSEKQFYDTLAGGSDKEALVFVHGFNNSFEDSAYRFAQILFDLQYRKPAVLFSWASKGSVADYGYDKESALIARDSFTTLLRSLRARGIEKIHVIAHSMGNLVVIDALANAADSTDPDRVAQLIMAAPDVDSDYFKMMEPKLAKISDGMTLYACATDRALMLSKRVAGGVPRAGDVPSSGPIVLSGLDTIDVSALGQDWFGLNHDVFASNRAVIDDMFQLLSAGKHPPRLAQVRGMPEGILPSTFWRFQP